MILYVLLAAFVVGLAGGAGGMNWWNDSRNAARERDLAEAQAKVDELAAESRAQAQQSMEAERVAYIAGEANAKVITKVIYERGKAYAATNAVLSNPQCYIPANGLQLIASARTGTEPAAFAPGSDGPMPGAGTNQGGSPGRGAVPVGDVPPDSAGRSGGGGMPTQAGSAGSTGAVSGTSPRGVPTNPLKPK